MDKTEEDATTAVVKYFDQEGILKACRENYHELISLGEVPQRSLCRLLRDNMVSSFGLNYFILLNTLVKKHVVGMNEKSKHSFFEWLDDNVMEIIDSFHDTEAFDKPKSLSALADIIGTLCSSMDSIEEEDIEEEVDYIFDIPYRLVDMRKDSKQIPGFYRFSIKYEDEEEGKKERWDINASDRSLGFHYKVTV